MRLKLRMVKGTTAMALFAALVAYMVAHPRLVHATLPGLNGRISFALFSSSPNSTSIWSARSDGSGPLQLTSDSANQNSVDSNWSPNGSRIAFDSDRSSNGINDILDIFTMKADGSDVVQLTSSPVRPSSLTA